MHELRLNDFYLGLLIVSWHDNKHTFLCYAFYNSTYKKIFLNDPIKKSNSTIINSMQKNNKIKNNIPLIFYSGDIMIISFRGNRPVI